jgi:hypothetical protein
MDKRLLDVMIMGYRFEGQFQVKGARSTPQTCLVRAKAPKSSKGPWTTVTLSHRDVCSKHQALRSRSTSNGQGQAPATGLALPIIVLACLRRGRGRS